MFGNITTNKARTFAASIAAGALLAGGSAALLAPSSAGAVTCVGTGVQTNSLAHLASGIGIGCGSPVSTITTLQVGTSQSVVSVSGIIMHL